MGMMIEDEREMRTNGITNVEIKHIKQLYENRLKDDMMAMLTEIQLELDEMKITKVRSAGFAPYSKDPFRRGVNCSKEVIQQKIDALKEDKKRTD